MKVIGIGAQFANGKDVVANYLAEKLNNNVLYYEDKWQRIGFAHAVKKVFMDTFNVDWDFIEEWKRKDEAPPGFNINVRKGLQFIGDGFRQIKSDIWIETAFHNNTPKIISDVRYLNEARAIRKHGGMTVLLWRKNYENNDPNPSESQIKPVIDYMVRSGHEGSMKSLDAPEDVKLFDFFIRNEGTIDDLYRKVDAMLLPEVYKWFSDSDTKGN